MIQVYLATSPKSAAMLDQLNDLRIHNQRFQAELSSAIERVLASGWFALGPEVEAFEREFASYCGAAHCVGVANGTDALELALRGVGVEPGDSVITAANAGSFGTHAILAAGARPVYADIQRQQLGLCPRDVAERIEPSTRAVIVTHLFGRMADVRALRSLADRHGLALIEDCAQAHGAELEGIKAGAWGDAAAFSFYPTKNLGALGDAGAVLTRTADVCERVRRLRQYGWSTKYVSQLPGGRNSRLDELQAAVLRVKLPRLDELNTQRRALAHRWSAELTHPRIECPEVDGEDFVAHLFVVQADERDALRAYLGERGIACDLHYPLLDYEHPGLPGLAPASPLAVTEKVRSRILTLPCYPELSPADIAGACEQINAWDV